MNINLGDLVQDDQGVQWLAVQECRHWTNPTQIYYVLKEHCLRDHRSAIVWKDGTHLVGNAVISTRVTKVISNALASDGTV